MATYSKDFQNQFVFLSMLSYSSTSFVPAFSPELLFQRCLTNKRQLKRFQLPLPLCSERINKWVSSFMNSFAKLLIANVIHARDLQVPTLEKIPRTRICSPVLQSQVFKETKVAKQASVSIMSVHGSIDKLTWSSRSIET